MMFDPSGTALDGQVEPGDLNIFIGPEGGWSEKELEQAKMHNLKIKSLGARILRAETAAIISSFLVTYA